MMICLMEHATEDWLHPHLLQHLSPPHTLFLCRKVLFFKAKRVLRRGEEKGEDPMLQQYYVIKWNECYKKLPKALGKLS